MFVKVDDSEWPRRSRQIALIYLVLYENFFEARRRQQQQHLKVSEIATVFYFYDNNYCKTARTVRSDINKTC